MSKVDSSQIELSAAELRALARFASAPRHADGHAERLISSHLVERTPEFVMYTDGDKRIVYRLSDTGASVLYRHRRERTRFLVPVVISAIALIGAYREELVLVVQAIVQLLKQLAESLGIGT